MADYRWYTQHDNGIDPVYVDEHFVGELEPIKERIRAMVRDGDAGDGWITQRRRLVWRYSDYWEWEVA